MIAQRCPYCGHLVELLFIHGHYQCPVCGANVLPCCEGETAQPENGQAPVCPFPEAPIKEDKTETGDP